MNRTPLFIVLASLLGLCAPFAPLASGAAPTTRPARAPFEREIEAFEAADARKAPPQGAVVFLGSSSIRLWKSVATDFPQFKVVNRGFGGSTIPDSTRYLSRIVTPIHPRAIVFYAGDNDVAQHHSAERVLADFKALVAAVHEQMPGTPLLFIAIKPSLAREKQQGVQDEANKLVRDYIAGDKDLRYIDIVKPMLDEAGHPRPELFRPDGLHMNEKGYAIWTKLVTPVLDALLAPNASTSDHPAK